MDKNLKYIYPQCIGHHQKHRLPKMSFITKTLNGNNKMYSDQIKKITTNEKVNTYMVLNKLIRRQLSGNTPNI